MFASHFTFIHVCACNARHDWFSIGTNHNEKLVKGYSKDERRGINDG